MNTHLSPQPRPHGLFAVGRDLTPTMHAGRDQVRATIALLPLRINRRFLGMCSTASRRYRFFHQIQIVSPVQTYLGLHLPSQSRSFSSNPHLVITRRDMLTFHRRKVPILAQPTSGQTSLWFVAFWFRLVYMGWCWLLVTRQPEQQTNTFKQSRFRILSRDSPTSQHHHHHYHPVLVAFFFSPAQDL